MKIQKIQSVSGNAVDIIRVILFCVCSRVLPKTFLSLINYGDHIQVSNFHAITSDNCRAPKKQEVKNLLKS